MIIKRSIAAAVLIGASAFPVAAQARVQAAMASTAIGGGLSVPTPTTATSGGSFQWGDAGIGAAGATVLLGAGALTAGTTRRRRNPAVN